LTQRSARSDDSAVLGVCARQVKDRIATTKAAAKLAFAMLSKSQPLKAGTVVAPLPLSSGGL